MEFTVRAANHDGVPVLHLTGDLDLYGVTSVRQEMAQIAHQGAEHAVVDLTDVDTIDSCGLGVLVGAHKQMRRQGGTLSLVVAREAMLRTFRISSLARLLDIHGDLGSAVNSAPQRRRVTVSP